MKTILVPTEQTGAMEQALNCALLLAEKFAGRIEGFALRPAVAEMVAMDPDAGMTMVAVKENDADMVRQSEELFRGFMQRRGVPQQSAEASPAAVAWAWNADAPSGHDFVGSSRSPWLTNPCFRSGSTIGWAVVHGRQRKPDNHWTAAENNSATGILHAVFAK